MNYLAARSVCNSHRHALNRAEAHGIDLALEDIVRLEETILRMRPAFVRPNTDQYFLTIKFRNARFAALYNNRLGSIVTFGRARPLISGPATCFCEARPKT